MAFTHAGGIAWRFPEMANGGAHTLLRRISVKQEGCSIPGHLTNAANSDVIWPLQDPFLSLGDAEPLP